MRFLLVLLLALAATAKGGDWKPLRPVTDKDLRLVLNSAWALGMSPMSFNGCDEGVAYAEFTATVPSKPPRDLVWQVINFYDWEHDDEQGGSTGVPVETMILWTTDSPGCPGRNELIEPYVQRHPNRVIMILDYVWGSKTARVQNCPLSFLGAVLKDAAYNAEHQKD